MATDTKGYVEPGAGLKSEEAERAKALNLRIAWYMRKGLSESAAKTKAIEELGGTTTAVKEARKAAKLSVPLPPPKPPEPEPKAQPEAPKAAAPKPSAAKPAVKAYSGVALRGGKIHPYWTVDGKIKWGASRPTEKEAAEERDRMLVELNGFKAVAGRLNFPEMFRPKDGAAAEPPPAKAADPRGMPRTILLPKPEDEPTPEDESDDIERSIASFDRPARPEPVEPQAVTFDPREPEAVPHGAPAAIAFPDIANPAEGCTAVSPRDAVAYGQCERTPTQPGPAPTVVASAVALVDLQRRILCLVDGMPAATAKRVLGQALNQIVFAESEGANG